VHNFLLFDEDLIKRYDLPGPRYTSYPTAAEFKPNLSAHDLIKVLNNSKSQSKDLSLYVHIPFCSNICYYCACNKIITKNKTLSASYLEHLQQEISFIASFLSKKQIVKQLHFGGGTPTFLEKNELKQIINVLKNNFNFSEDDASRDFGIEIDPRKADWQTMGLLRELGFNRVSFGIQDLNIEVQKAVNRVQDLTQIQNLIDAARTMAYHSINMDLIYGLPKQTPATFAQTLQQIITMQPDRLSIFNYAHLPHRFKPQRRINAEDLPSSSAKLLMFKQTMQALHNAGYIHIGMDHFALPSDELSIAKEQHLLQRNFQGYSTHGKCDLLGFGASAISAIGNLYVQNFSALEDYQTAIAQNKCALWRGVIKNSDDAIRHFVISEIMCHNLLNIKEFNQKFKLEFNVYFADVLPKLAPMIKDGLLSLNNDFLEVLPSGKLLVRIIAMQFDAYLQQNEQRFSKVI